MGKTEKEKQHYEKFSQYLSFQTKSGNIGDPIKEGIELFEYTLNKKALVWLQEHKDKFTDLTTLKTLFLSRYNLGVRQNRTASFMEPAYI